MKFKPRRSDVEWQENLLRVISDGGIWMTHNATYRINKVDKTLTVIEMSDAISDPVENIFCVTEVCRKLGWKVIIGSKGLM